MCSLLFISAVIGCDAPEHSTSDLDDKLSQFEETLDPSSANNPLYRLSDYSVESLANPNNHYDYEGLLLWNTFKEIEARVEYLIPLQNASYLVDVQPYIDNKLTNIRVIGNLNSDEQTLLSSLENNFRPSVDLILDYENFVARTYTDQARVKNFLILLSRIKYNIFIHNADVNHRRRSLTAWENCVVQCVRTEYNNYNVVNWVQFALSPGADVLWTAASCGWECRRTGYYGY